jgi:hypothetical protein
VTQGRLKGKYVMPKKQAKNLFAMVHHPRKRGGIYGGAENRYEKARGVVMNITKT